MPKKELKVKMIGELNDVIAQMEAVINSLKEGKVVIQKNNSFISLTPQDQVTLEIEAEQKKDKEELSIELSWRSADIITGDSSTGLSISSNEPEIPEEEASEDKEEKEDEEKKESSGGSIF
jgi:amphi-Trp domain-containing protein